MKNQQDVIGDTKCGAGRSALLTDRCKSLLEKYYDGECSWLERFRAATLLKRSDLAARYLKSLERTHQDLFQSSQMKRAALQKGCSEEDLWAKIDQRIEAEERAKLFLGERSLGAKPGVNGGSDEFSFFDLFGRRVSNSRGAFGAAVACSAIAVFGLGYWNEFAPSSDEILRGDDRVAALSNVSESGNGVNLGNEPIRIIHSNPVPVELVSSSMNHRSRSLSGSSMGGVNVNSGMFSEPLTADNFDPRNFDGLVSGSRAASSSRSTSPSLRVAQGGSANRQQMFVSQNHSPSVEVDWMKSDGRVRILSGPHAQAPIIFVKKRRPLALRDVPSSAISPAYVGGGALSGNGIVLQEPAVPATSFANR
ncbi:MAG: hypothetical protein KDD70_11155 [Bdellovibrionales bacterium]|nr:hypothetical protein [Bdellovibrionales bacterium]